MSSASVYRGRVGARMRPFKLRTRKPRATPRRAVHQTEGPLAGSLLFVGPGLNTLDFTLRGHTGHYQAQNWVPLSSA